MADTPTPASRPLWEVLGMTEEAFMRMPSAWRSARWYEQRPPPEGAHPRRPVSRILTAEELKSLEGLPWAERSTKGRQMQQTPPARP